MFIEKAAGMNRVYEGRFCIAIYIVKENGETIIKLLNKTFGTYEEADEFLHENMHKANMNKVEKDFGIIRRVMFNVIHMDTVYELTE